MGWKNYNSKKISIRLYRSGVYVYIRNVDDLQNIKEQVAIDEKK